MAHNTVPLTALTLIDNWPGVVNPAVSIPTDGWDNTKDNFTTTAAGQLSPVRIGQKRMAYSDNSHAPGWYTMMYLKYHTFEDSDISIGDFCANTGICCHYDASQAEDYKVDISKVPYFVVSNDITDTDAGTAGELTPGMRVSFPCATMSSDGSSALTDGFGDVFGWHWVGGVCPVNDATILDDLAGTGVGAGIGCGSMMISGGVIAGISTASIYIESPDMSAVSNADNSEGGNVPGLMGFIDTSGIA